MTSTGIGRTVNALRKDDGEIGTAAKQLISKWKQMVASQESDVDDGNVEEHQSQLNYDYEGDNVDASQIQTESVGHYEETSHRDRDYSSKGSNSNNNHHHNHYYQQEQEQKQSQYHHHHDQSQHHAHEPGNMSDNHNTDKKV